MAINTNWWNKIRYTLYTPGYDKIANVFRESRKRSIDSLGVVAGDKVLIIGAGTGLDLEFLPKDCQITATDITPSMVRKIKDRNKEMELNVEAMVMDGQMLQFENRSFDKVILHLILAVIPDPVACIKEAERVLRSGGEVVVFDKFIRGERKISLLRKGANLFTNFFFSDITRDLEAIVSKTSLAKISDQDADFNGNFRLIKLRKP